MATAVVVVVVDAGASDVEVVVGTTEVVVVGTVVATVVGVVVDMVVVVELSKEVVVETLEVVDGIVVGLMVVVVAPPE